MPSVGASAAARAIAEAAEPEEAEPAAASAARYAIIGLNADASNTEYLRGQIEAYLTAFGHFEPGRDADAKRERVTAEITAAIAAQ